MLAEGRETDGEGSEDSPYKVDLNRVPCRGSLVMSKSGEENLSV